MSLLHKPKKEQQYNDRLMHAMMPTIAGILACIFCLVSMTWAWFSASVNTQSPSIRFATRQTYVKVYKVENADSENETTTLVQPSDDTTATQEAVLLDTNEQIDKDASIITADEALVWNLEPNASYKVELKGGGTASTGYCKLALSYVPSESENSETKLYKTAKFDKGNQLTFTYNTTDGVPNPDDVTATEWNAYIEKQKETPPTLTIASYWGEPTDDNSSQATTMSLRGITPEFILLADGDVLGMPPVPRPEEFAEINFELDCFQVPTGGKIPVGENYNISLTPIEGYEMPDSVTVSIGENEYTVSTQGAEATEGVPYFDIKSGMLTIPASLLGDGVNILVKATAIQIPVEEEKPEDETTAVPPENTQTAPEETTDNASDEKNENNANNTILDDNLIADDPEKEEDSDQSGDDDADKMPTGDGDDDDHYDGYVENTTNEENSSSDKTDKEETEDTSKTETETGTEEEKADVTLNLSQLTINLKETQIPTNADLILTLTAKEGMQFPKQIAVTLDKTDYDSETETETEQIQVDKTEYIVYTDGTDNPDGFSFDAESGMLKISSELLDGVREIAIADVAENNTDKNDEQTTLSFEVTNLTFDFSGDEIVTNEDIVVIFTADEGYTLPQTIIVYIDDTEYIIYTSAEESDKNPEGITFDALTGTLNISKDLLKDAKAIVIAANGVKKADETTKPENTDTSNSDATTDKETQDKDNTGSSSGDNADNKPEGGTDSPSTDSNPETEEKTETGDNKDTEEKTETEDKTETETDTENKGETSSSETDITAPNTPDTEKHPTNTEQSGNGEESDTGEESGDDGESENGGESTTTQTTPDNSSSSSTTTVPTNTNEPVTSAETSSEQSPAATEPPTSGTGGNDGNDGNDNGESDADGTCGSDE